MFMKAKRRTTKGGEGYIYYILCGSWRDSQGLTMRDELLHLGRHDDFDVWEMREVADIVTDRANVIPARPNLSGAAVSMSVASLPTRLP